jgi:hypothetical protein
MMPEDPFGEDGILAEGADYADTIIGMLVLDELAEGSDYVIIRRDGDGWEIDGRAYSDGRDVTSE